MITRDKSYRPHHWLKYGLSIDRSIIGWDFTDACINHNLVHDFLEEHPETAAEYEVDQSGRAKYFHILSMAEKEAEGAP